MGEFSSFPERKVEDFYFKQLKKLQIFDSPDSLPLARGHLLAVSNKYGLCFVGCPTGVKIIKTDIIGNINKADERNINAIVSEYPSIHINIGEAVRHVGISADSITLSVCYEKGNNIILRVYDIPTICTQTGSQEMLGEVVLSADAGSSLVNLLWNPLTPNIFAACFSNGSVTMWEMSDTKITKTGSLPVSTRATAICWSPKGKQVVVGHKDGHLTQYSPTLELKKETPIPEMFKDNPRQVTSICWISAAVFLNVYTTEEEGDMPQCVLLCNATKTFPKQTINFEDVYIGMNEDREKGFYTTHLLEWNVALSVSCNAFEVAVFGNEQNWEKWTFEDEKRAEMPLTKDKDETYPMGMAIDFTSTIPIVENERSYPPAPLLLLLSTDGVLCPFYMVNKKPNAKHDIVKPAEPLPPPGPRPKIMGNAPLQSKTPEQQGGQKQPVFQLPKTAPTLLTGTSQPATKPSFFSSLTTSSSSSPFSLPPSYSSQPVANATSTKPFNFTTPSTLGFPATPVKPIPTESKTLSSDAAAVPATKPFFTSNLLMQKSDSTGQPGSGFSKSGFPTESKTLSSDAAAVPSTKPFFTSNLLMQKSDSTGQPGSGFSKSGFPTESKTLSSDAAAVPSMKPFFTSNLLMQKSDSTGQPGSGFSKSGFPTESKTLSSDAAAVPSMKPFFTSNLLMQKSDSTGQPGSGFSKSGFPTESKTLSSDAAAVPSTKPFFTSNLLMQKSDSTGQPGSGFSKSGPTQNTSSVPLLKPMPTTEPLSTPTETDALKGTSSSGFFLRPLESEQEKEQQIKKQQEAQLEQQQLQRRKQESQLLQQRQLEQRQQQQERQEQEQLQQRQQQQQQHQLQLRHGQQEHQQQLQLQQQQQQLHQEEQEQQQQLLVQQRQQQLRLEEQEQQQQLLLQQRQQQLRQEQQERQKLRQQQIEQQQQRERQQPMTQQNLELSVTKCIIEEIELFNKELEKLAKDVHQVKHVCSEFMQSEELERLRVETELEAKMGDELKQVAKDHNCEIQDAKKKLLGSFEILEDARVRHHRAKDPHYHHLLKSRGLDPINANKMKRIRELYMHLDKTLSEVNLVLDEEWNKENESQNKIQRPTMDAVYRTLQAHHRIAQDQSVRLDKLAEKMKRKKLLSLSWNKASTSIVSSRDNMHELSSLSGSMKSLDLESTTRSSFKVPDNIPANKSARLINMLRKRQTTPIRRSTVVNPDTSRARHIQKRLAELTNLSPPSQQERLVAETPSVKSTSATQPLFSSTPAVTNGSGDAFVFRESGPGKTRESVRKEDNAKLFSSSTAVAKTRGEDFVFESNVPGIPRENILKEENAYQTSRQPQNDFTSLSSTSTSQTTCPTSSFSAPRQNTGVPPPTATTGAGPQMPVQKKLFDTTGFSTQLTGTPPPSIASTNAGTSQTTGATQLFTYPETTRSTGSPIARSTGTPPSGAGFTMPFSSTETSMGDLQSSFSSTSTVTTKEAGFKLPSSVLGTDAGVGEKTTVLKQMPQHTPGSSARSTLAALAAMSRAAEMHAEKTNLDPSASIEPRSMVTHGQSVGEKERDIESENLAARSIAEEVLKHSQLEAKNAGVKPQSSTEFAIKGTENPKPGPPVVTVKPVTSKDKMPPSNVTVKPVPVPGTSLTRPSIAPPINMPPFLKPEMASFSVPAPSSGTISGFSFSAVKDAVHLKENMGTAPKPSSVSFAPPNTKKETETIPTSSIGRGSAIQPKSSPLNSGIVKPGVSPSPGVGRQLFRDTSNQMKDTNDKKGQADGPDDLQTSDTPAATGTPLGFSLSSGKENVAFGATSSTSSSSKPDEGVSSGFKFALPKSGTAPFAATPGKETTTTESSSEVKPFSGGSSAAGAGPIFGRTSTTAPSNVFKPFASIQTTLSSSPTSLFVTTTTSSSGLTTPASFSFSSKEPSSTTPTTSSSGVSAGVGMFTLPPKTTVSTVTSVTSASGVFAPSAGVTASQFSFMSSAQGTSQDGILGSTPATTTATTKQGGTSQGGISGTKITAEQGGLFSATTTTSQGGMNQMKDTNDKKGQADGPDDLQTSDTPVATGTPLGFSLSSGKENVAFGATSSTSSSSKPDEGVSLDFKFALPKTGTATFAATPGKETTTTESSSEVMPFSGGSSAGRTGATAPSNVFRPFASIQTTLSSSPTSSSVSTTTSSSGLTTPASFSFSSKEPSSTTPTTSSAGVGMFTLPPKTTSSTVTSVTSAGGVAATSAGVTATQFSFMSSAQATFQDGILGSTPATTTATPKQGGTSQGSISGTKTTVSQGENPQGGLFGAKTTAEQGGPFGTSTTTSQGGTPQGGLFGAKTTAEQGGPFGTTTTTSQGGTPQGGLFGAKTTAEQGGLFSATTTTSQGGTPQGGFFGAKTTAEQGGLFSATITTSQGGTPQGGLFGAKTAAEQGGLFGTTTTTSQGGTPQGGPFGVKTTAEQGGFFGTTTTTSQGGTPQGGLFGTTPTSSQGGTPQGGLFGTTTTTSQGGTPQGGLFGSSQAGTQGGLFPASTTSQIGTGHFGSPSSSTASAFGQPSFAQPAFGQPTSGVASPTSSSSGQSAFSKPQETTSSGTGLSFGGFGLGGQPSQQADKNPFLTSPTSTPSTGSSLFGTSTSTGFQPTFASGSPSSFGSQSSGGFGGGSFSRGTGNVASSGFSVGGGGSPGFGSLPAFGGAPAFGPSSSFGSSSSSFGSAPVFGSVPQIGMASSGGSFGSSTGGSSFGSVSGSPTFGALAHQSTTPSFGNMAQQAEQGQPGFGGFAQQSTGFGGFGSPGGSAGASPAFGGSPSQSFSQWR